MNNRDRLPPMCSDVETVNACAAFMRYKPKSIAALQLPLGGLPDLMRVEVDSGIEISAKTVRELRKVTVWPENLAITTPQERGSGGVLRVSKANVATRTSPKS
jgi:hypothetical protein